MSMNMVDDSSLQISINDDMRSGYTLMSKQKYSSNTTHGILNATTIMSQYRSSLSQLALSF